MKTSREHMLLVALRLFAQKGYEATSIFDIAHELEITKGAIYKHFKNKQDILDAIISKMEENDQRFAEQFIMPIHVLSLEELEAYQKVTIKQVIDFSLAMFTYWTEDEFASLFRKMLTIEQYHDEKMNLLYQNYLGDGPYQYILDIFKTMELKDYEEKALIFYGPMFSLYSLSDIDLELAKERLQKHFQHMLERLV
ncbi:transcriptional regulator TetR family [Coprobacillus sp. CAG:826]|nr:transcriptional regulator TetR family [Coprobacillus sp. CAG:826]